MGETYPFTLNSEAEQRVRARLGIPLHEENQTANIDEEIKKLNARFKKIFDDLFCPEKIFGGGLEGYLKKSLYICGRHTNLLDNSNEEDATKYVKATAAKLSGVVTDVCSLLERLYQAQADIPDSLVTCIVRIHWSLVVAGIHDTEFSESIPEKRREKVLSLWDTTQLQDEEVIQVFLAEVSRHCTNVAGLMKIQRIDLSSRKKENKDECIKRNLLFVLYYNQVVEFLLKRNFPIDVISGLTQQVELLKKEMQVSDQEQRMIRLLKLEHQHAFESAWSTIAEPDPENL